MESRIKTRERFGKWAVILSATVALCVVLPFLYLGIPSGHDFEFHFNSWLEVVGHVQQGVLYPHWAALAHWGYGEARFIFYPPASWILGALLGAILPWKLVPAAYIVIALTLSGMSMFKLARQWLSLADALLAPLIYTANPYYLVIVYWRSAMAELLAAALLPLLLLYALRLEDDGKRVILPLSLVLAAGWLTNIPTAVMMNYSLALFLFCVAISRRSLIVLVYGAAAVALGAALAAVYLVPVFHQQSWVNIAQVLGPGVRPTDNFLFTVTSDRDHNRFNRMVSVVAVWEIVIVAGAMVLSRKARTQRIWWFMLAWTVVSSVLMLRITVPLWNQLPELRIVQFPWRWLLCLNVVFALGMVMAFRRWWLRGLVLAVALGSVVLVWQRIQPPWWDTAADIREMVDNQRENIGNEGTDEYVPAGVDPYDIDQKAPQVRFEGRGTARIQVDLWQAEKRLIRADASAPGKLVLRLFQYPLWRVEVNGHAVQTEVTRHTGQMIVPVKVGTNQVQITFESGWDRQLGAAISLLTLIGLGFWALSLKKETPAPAKLAIEADS